MRDLICQRILFLSSITKNSNALREEIDYGINKKGLPVIVIYPDFKEKSDIYCSSGFKNQISSLWKNLPIFRDNMDKVATLHIPYDKNLIIDALNNSKFTVQNMATPKRYYY